MIRVNIFTIQRPVGNPVSISKLYKAFGNNIPRYQALEGGDYNGPQYQFCVDMNVDFESVCEKYNYKTYPAYKFEVEKSKDNTASIIALNLEKGIYNYSIKQATERNIVKKWDNPFYVQIYTDHLKSLILNIILFIIISIEVITILKKRSLQKDLVQRVNIFYTR